MIVLASVSPQYSSTLIQERRWTWQKQTETPQEKHQFHYRTINSFQINHERQQSARIQKNPIKNQSSYLNPKLIDENKKTHQRITTVRPVVQSWPPMLSDKRKFHGSKTDRNRPNPKSPQFRSIPVAPPRIQEKILWGGEGRRRGEESLSPLTEKERGRLPPRRMAHAFAWKQATEKTGVMAVDADAQLSTVSRSIWHIFDHEVLATYREYFRLFDFPILSANASRTRTSMSGSMLFHCCRAQR